MKQWSLMLLGIVAALLVQHMLPPEATWSDFLLLFALAALLFLMGAPAAGEIGRQGDRETGKQGNKETRGKSRVWRALGGTLLALICAGAAGWRLWADLGDKAGLYLWGAAILLLLLSWWQRDITSYPALGTPNSAFIRWEWPLLLFLVVLAFAVRSWQLDTYPNGIQSDESNNANDALKWLAGAPYTPYSEVNEGQATLFTYLIALCFKLFGVNATAMRLAAVIVGTLTVASFYWLARAFFTREIALFTTALLTFSRWHMTFSRIAYELILTPLAAIWLFYWLYRGMTKRGTHAFVLAGLALAFGLNTYTAFRVMPLGVAVLILYWLLSDLPRWRGNLGRLLLFGLSALVGALPLLIYVVQKPEVVLIRTTNVSIFKEIAAVGSWEPFWFNLRKYALMFNVVGDPAPLNNLPSAPMLGWIEGALFVLGLAYALRNWRDLRLFTLLAWMLAVLPAGLLTVTVETPSARRMIGLLPVIYLAIGWVALAVYQATQVTWRGQWKRAGSLLAVGLVLVVASSNLLKFYNVQAKDLAVRRAFNPEESAVGRYLAAIDAGQLQIYLDPRYVGNGIVRFLAPGLDYTPLSSERDIPLSAAQPQTVLYLLAPANAFLQPLLEHFYPGGAWQAHTDEAGAIVFHTFLVTPEQQHASYGVTASYFPADSWAQPPLLTRSEPTFGADGWPFPLPLQGEWQGGIQAMQHGNYRFTLQADPPYTLTIDTAVALTSTLASMQVITHPLPAGFHNFSLRAAIRKQAPQVTWVGAGQAVGDLANGALANGAPPVGLIGAYYANPDWQGAPAVVRRDLIVTANHTLPEPYSVIWRGKLWTPVDGHYTLGVNADDGAQLLINGQMVVDNGGSHGAQYRDGGVDLNAGLHDIEIRYFQAGGSQALDLFWAPPGAAQQPLPLDHLLPYALDASQLVNLAQPAPAATTEKNPTAANTPMTQITDEAVNVLDEANGAWQAPRGLAIGPDDNVYVLDSGHQRLVGLTAQGEFRFETSTGGAAFVELADVGVNSENQIYVLDAGAARLDLFDSQGQFVRTIPAPREIVDRARGIFVRDNGQIWVAATANASVVALNAQGEALQRFPLPGYQPVDVAVDANGAIFVSDVEKHQLLELDGAGNLLRQWPIAVANGVDGPHLALDTENRLYLSEPEQGIVVTFDLTRTQVTRQRLPARSGPTKPVGLAVDSQGRIWLADSSSNLVWIVK
jgi:streptogramin lyase/4-amino-4-deoxy-L-arabinose transferase-like glycosyltransferase